MANKLQKVEGEPLLYLNPVSRIYFLRKHDAQRDTHVSLKTTKIGAARQLRDDYVGALRMRALGLAVPETKKEPCLSGCVPKAGRPTTG
jgi:hypothetical protein